MVTFKNLNDLAKYVNTQSKQSLKDEIAPLVKSKMQSHVESDVYSVYVPSIYERTGGLKRDIDIRETSNGVSVVPTRTDEVTGNYIPHTVETGQGYLYSGYGLGYERPRPFVENTVKELQSTGEHVNKLRQSLQAKGLSVK
ncbi:hypothetical protein [Brevibacillus sp. NRS-1366]|uniref:hypothetical protein n=1 Tax=Brevibacillus sp. NRS-1366 TaxID=3233899 RepID=UPI003D221471